MISLAIAIAVSALLVAACLAAAMKLRSAPLRFVDILIIAVVCSGLAPLPVAGWALATIIMYLLVTRLMDVDFWPDTVILVAAANVVWVLVLGTF